MARLFYAILSPREVLRRHPKITSDAAWVGFSSVAAAVGTLAGNRLITQIFPPKGFGTVTLLVAAANLLRQLLWYPLAQAAVRMYVDVDRRGDVWRLRRLVARFLLRAGALMSAAALFLGTLYSWLSGASYWVTPLLLGAVALDMARSIQMEYLSIARTQRPVAVMRFLDCWVRPMLIAAALLLMGRQTAIYLLGQFAGSLALALGFFTFLHRRSAPPAISLPPAEPQKDRALAREMFHFALPLLPVVIIGFITGVSDRYFIGAFLGEESVGVYAANYALASQPLILLHGMIAYTIMGAYLASVAAGDRARERKLFRLRLLVTISLGVTGWLLLWALRYPLARLLLGSSYRWGADLMPWIAGGYVLNDIAQVFVGHCSAHKRSDLVLIIEGSAATVCLLTEILLIKYLGIRGAAIAVPCYFGAQLAVAMAVFRPQYATERAEPAPLAPGGETQNNAMGSGT